MSSLQTRLLFFSNKNTHYKGKIEISFAILGGAHLLPYRNRDACHLVFYDFSILMIFLSYEPNFTN